MKCITWTEIEEIARRGDTRFNFIVRHAERPPLEPGDRTFGATLPLTARGERDAESFGRRLYEVTGGRLPDVWAGGTRRTVGPPVRGSALEKASDVSLLSALWPSPAGACYNLSSGVPPAERTQGAGLTTRTLPGRDIC